MLKCYSLMGRQWRRPNFSGGLLMNIIEWTEITIKIRYSIHFSISVSIRMVLQKSTLTISLLRMYYVKLKRLNTSHKCWLVLLVTNVLMMSWRRRKNTSLPNMERINSGIPLLYGIYLWNGRMEVSNGRNWNVRRIKILFRLINMQFLVVSKMKFYFNGVHHIH